MTKRRWIEYIVSILVGNAIYFLVLYPALPRSLQHQPFRVLDAGLLLDFVLCVLVYGVIRLAVAHARRWNERTARRFAPRVVSRGAREDAGDRLSGDAGEPSDTRRSRRAPRG